PAASAAPSALTGTSSTPQNAAVVGPPRVRRPREKGNPMRKPYRPLKTVSRPIMSLTQMGQPKHKLNANPDPFADGIPLQKAEQEYPALGAQTLPLVVTRRDLKELRHHVMRLQQTKGKPVDVTDPDDFTPPIRLHRRDPRAPLSGAGSHFEDEESKEDLEELENRAKMEQQREARAIQQAERDAQIAPSGKKKGSNFQKKTEQKFRPDDTPEAQKRRLLRYEETLPWHLEDFENSQTWVGAYEAELSEAHVMLTTAFENGKESIQMIPLERWYKFVTKGKVKSVPEEGVDPYIKAEAKLPTFLSNIEQISLKKEREYAARGKGRMKTRVGDKDEDGGAARRGGDDDIPRIKHEADADDIDFNMEEDFADDEEGLNGLFEGDADDIKDATERLKRDQLASGVFELRNETDIYRQEEQEREEREQQRLLEKQLRKALTKREKNIDYETDRSNPYESSSEEEDSEDEKKRLEEEKKEAEEEKNGKPAEGDQASGTSTKGTTTPSGVHKSVDLNKKKRPGSPNLSEASGNESSRKKHKKKHLDGSRKSSLVHLSGKGAASGSDSEMTDAGKPKKPKLKVKLGGSPAGSPGTSRAGSPAVNGSRAGSPAAATSATSPIGMPSALEIHNAMPASGMNIGTLLAAFKGRVNPSNNKIFIKLVKAISTFDSQRKWITPLPQLP
ncbi:hypothetical protein BDV96DRAFT_466829, partial [Lophiotrema nucula]